MTVSRRQVWVSAVTALAVSVATGTVQAQAVIVPAQIDTFTAAVERLVPIFGSLAVFILIALALIYRILALRQPVTNNDLELLKEQNRTKELALEEKNITARELRDAKRDEQDAKRAEQMDRMLAQLEKDHNRMHDNEAARMVEVRADVEAKRELKSEVVGYHEEVRALATELNAELLRLTARITAVENSTVATSRRIGTDDSVASIQSMIAQLVSGVHRLIELAAHPPTIPVPIPVPTEAKPNETLNPNPATLPADGGPRASADATADASADAGDNPQ